MRDYFIRRLLLIPPTFIGVTLLVFCITWIVPGGPLERAIMEAQIVDAQSGRSMNMAGEGQALSDEQLQELKEMYGFDKPLPIAYAIWLGKAITGNLGESFRYQEPVLEMVRDRIPISGFYGLMTLLIIYTVCIPLGIVKAIKHRTAMDNVTSLIVFTGYAIPGYVLGALLVVFLAARTGWFPMGGFVSNDFEDLSALGKVKDLFHHAVLPLACYLIGGFAVTTFLMKNHLLENLSADYMRTAIAKGVSFKRAVFGHALRNSLIPIATTVGQNIVFLVSGSFLIETIFDINGFGLLGFQSVLDRDYPVVIGVVAISSLLLMLGNILSDVIVACIDPRIRFR